ncbi:MAG: hypothetical protein QM530_02170 [Phycisphaerales bacterium]|nr:hypothetical protein [Phycisphaerales bacterium]
MYLSIKAKSFFFFSAANPTIETGGMFFESKWDVFKLIPKQYYPQTIFIVPEQTVESIACELKTVNIHFPFIAKPDRGERGWAVKIIHSMEELEEYRKKVKVSFLIQELVQSPLELSIFYYRHPFSQTGKITSVTLKKLLTVVGDGHSTLRELILRSDRATLQLAKLISNNAIDLNQVLNNQEELILVPYGNHVRGAMFLDYTHIVDEQLAKTFDTICKQIDGFYFGRFDLRCTSIEELKQGKNISILELNGSGAEPAHIYQPNFSFFKAQAVIARHYKMMYEAAMANKGRGIHFMSFDAMRETKKLETVYKKLVLGI